MGCPSCGAEIPEQDRFSVLTVCKYCNSAVVYDQKVALIAGKMSAIARPAGPLFVGGSGNIQKSIGFSVLGRVRYGYENGYWDEWYLKHDDQTISWLTEDEKRFMHEKPQKLEVEPETLKSLDAGQNIELNNLHFTIREKGVAICEGGEGQLPFKIVTGEEVFYLDLITNDGITATIEIEPEGEVKFFQGKPLQYTDISMDSEDPGRRDLAIEKGAGAGGRERVAYDVSRSVSIQCHSCGGTNDGVDLSQAHIHCSHCGTSLEVPANAFNCPSCTAQVTAFTSDAKSVNCNYCGAMVSLVGAEPTLLKKLKQKDLERKKKMKLRIPLGSKGLFDGQVFTVVGYIRFKEVDDGIFISDEYLMYNKEWGYRWLVCYEGHFTIEEKLERQPGKSPKEVAHYAYKRTLPADGLTWKFYESGKGRIDWVEGELSWVAKIGDKSGYVELINPPEMLVGEYTSNEVEWARYKYIERDEVAKAFKMKASDFPRPKGVGACQPNKNKSYHLFSALVALIFVILGFIGLGIAASSTGKLVSEFTLTPDQYKQEHLSKEFTLEKDNGIYRVDFYSPVDNSWVYLEMALVNEQDEAELDFSAEMSYYHGYDDGHWSEGSKEDSVYFKANKGNYKILTFGNAGAGESLVGLQHGKQVTVKIYQGVKVVYYFIFFIIFSGIISVYYIVRFAIFETSRWKHTMEED